MGGTVGTVVTWLLAGSLIQSFGWEYAFYVPSIGVALFILIWCLIVYDTPATHPRILKQEAEYIENNLPGITNAKVCYCCNILIFNSIIFIFLLQKWPPIGELLCSIPFWALLILHYGNMWGFYFLLTGAPRFMNEVQ